MRWFRIALAACVALCAAMVASAETGDAETRNVDMAAIRAVIAQQIEAFQAGDAETAFSFAAPGIRARFGDADRFIAMVKSGYGAIYGATDFTFGRIGGHHGVVLQQVDVTGPDGDSVRALYAMEKQSDGSWRIAGCQLVEPDGSDV